MKYEFKEGDYVETVGGDIGYIADECLWNVDNNPMIIYQETYDYIFKNDIENGFKRYNRIGKYDFTKLKHPKKIDNLPYEKTIEAKGGKDDVVLVKYSIPLDQNDIIDKLNEVIDRVNEIGGRNNDN